jgi:hypothetical protein
MGAGHHVQEPVRFNSGRNGGLDLYQTTAAAAAPSPGDAVLVDRDAKWPVSWSADGRYLLYVSTVRRWLIPGAEQRDNAPDPPVRRRPAAVRPAPRAAHVPLPRATSD